MIEDLYLIPVTDDEYDEAVRRLGPLSQREFIVTALAALDQGGLSFRSQIAVYQLLAEDLSNS